MNAKEDLFTIKGDTKNGSWHTFLWVNVEDIVLEDRQIYVILKTCMKVFYFDTRERAENYYNKLVGLDG